MNPQNDKSSRPRPLRVLQGLAYLYCLLLLLAQILGYSEPFVLIHISMWLPPPDPQLPTLASPINDSSQTPLGLTGCGCPSSTRLRAGVWERE